MNKIANYYVSFCYNHFTFKKYPRIIKSIIDIFLKISIKKLISQKNPLFIIPDIGRINFPLINFGNVMSYDIINVSELNMFKIYYFIADQYDIAIDGGANVGLHTIVMKLAGFKKIIAVEADPQHLLNLRRNLRINKIKSVKILNVAISNRFGKAVFIRLLGNLTGSHIEGSKEIVYGAVNKIYVPKISLKSLLNPGKNIFVKLDIEGQEFNALQSIKDEWQFVDVIAEISSKKNAELIFNFCRKNNLIIYSEKNRWKIATELFMMPNCWNEGSVLITKKTDFFNFLAIKSKGLFKQNR
jgi:FkbM family methyltransferase